MNSSDDDLPAIGGYFELELPLNQGHFHDAIRLNSARSCLALSLLRSGTKRLFLPRYICNSAIEPLTFHNIAFDFYSIDKDLEIKDNISLGKDEKILYVNYFGIKSRYTNALAKTYGPSLIIDSTQAFFETYPDSSDSVYSCRKFFGVPDGGYLLPNGNTNVSDYPIEQVSDRCRHLLGRLENGASQHYSDYKANEAALTYNGIKRMSRISERLLSSVDYDSARSIRSDNFQALHTHLQQFNHLSMDTDSVTGPMCYPLLSSSERLHEHLIRNNIFTPRYWTDVFEHDIRDDSIEGTFADRLVPLPIDQRYNSADMKIIINTIKQFFMP